MTVQRTEQEVGGAVKQVKHDLGLQQRSARTTTGKLTSSDLQSALMKLMGSDLQLNQE